MTDRSSESPPSPPPAPPGWTDTRGPLAPDAHTPLTRFLGGSPANVAMRLFFVSLIVGALFMWLDIRPADVLRGLTDLFNRISRLGFDAIREVINYVLVGAAVVVPIWLVLRLLNMRGK
ncbi:DUF6460 domain-containing protein [Methylocella silvestris]|uniref:DUF6460 domain-containing protein n=1 Tax=Methylocella silvestris TaxID=199596 RepID=A0A2J7TMV8_METSI|nr:DUF6460 domain-containing protein [Methylocella silvestris]PNG28057.1 hypothetical protein CR492_02735 [Methylocella silvestris]